MENTWVYIKSEPQLWTVGFYDPHGNWQPESDQDSHNDAANRVHFLNGGADSKLQQQLSDLQVENERLKAALKESNSVLSWHLDKSVPYNQVDQSDFFNITANAISQNESLIRKQS